MYPHNRTLSKPLNKKTVGPVTFGLCLDQGKTPLDSQDGCCEDENTLSLKLPGGSGYVYHSGRDLNDTFLRSTTSPGTKVNFLPFRNPNPVANDVSKFERLKPLFN